jgi:NAD(P)H-nitrite reductase large subunit
MSQLFRLKNGTVLLSTEAPGGIYNSGQLKKIAELCSKELAIVKATEDQRLALFVKESEVENVAKQLRAMGLGFRHYQDSLHQPVSCLGELCEEHEQPAMATAMDITKEIASLQVNAPLKIGINGCARCCTPCHTLDIAVVGDSSGYRISLGGKTRQMPEFASYFAEGVPAKELPKRLKAVIGRRRDFT